MTSDAPPSFAENLLTEIHQAICGTSKSMILLNFGQTKIFQEFMYKSKPQIVLGIFRRFFW